MVRSAHFHWNEVFANNHVSRCRAEFCYVCGLQWRTCACPQWDEARLLRRAEVIVARAPPQVNAPPEVDVPMPGLNAETDEVQRLIEAGRLQLQEAVQQAAQHLRERHECNHVRWRYVSGPHQCEECRHHLPRFINECQQCNLQACWRCRNNRL